MKHKGIKSNQSVKTKNNHNLKITLILLAALFHQRRVNLNAHNPF